MKRVLLSIDWDFFFPENPEWDFGHSEHHSTVLEDVLWHSRAAGMLSVGKDLQSLTAAHESVLPTQFWNELQLAGYNLKGARIGVGESHKAAAPFFLNVGMPNGSRIVHIDAHHDLGYCTRKALQDSVRRSTVDAGNWLGVLLHLIPTLTADIVWPQWKDHVDEDFARAPLSKKTQHRVTSRVWPAPDHGPVKVTGVFVCRSGAWVPPWHDEDFNKFVVELGKHTGSDVETIEPLRERSFSIKSIEAEAEILSKFRGKYAKISG